MMNHFCDNLFVGDVFAVLRWYFYCAFYDLFNFDQLFVVSRFASNLIFDLYPRNFTSLMILLKKAKHWLASEECWFILASLYQKSLFVPLGIYVPVEFLNRVLHTLYLGGDFYQMGLYG